MKPPLAATAFGAALVLLAGAKLVLVSDLAVHMVYSPHDDSLYAERAFHLLRGEAFGPYDPRVLVKYPGFTLWLAATRVLGIPFLLSVNALHLAAGAYVAIGLARAGLHRGLAFAAFALWAFNPVTLGFDWTRLIREPLATGLLALMVGAMLHVFVAVRGGQRAWPHLALLAPVFAFSLYVREDDRLLWLLLGLFALGAARLGARADWRPLALRAAGWAAAPALLAVAFSAVLHDFAERRYGAPVLHEFSEGEYPRLLAAIRSVASAKDNRMVMAPQDVLQKLRAAAPAFAPVVDRLPPPGPGTFSCRLHGVCSEWSNGWMPFWIKDAAHAAGLTPDLPRAQAYFAGVREAIERACASGTLRCAAKGGGLVPPMELRWTRAYVAEAWQLAGMALRPNPNIPRELPVTFSIDVELGKRIQAVTMSDYFDAQAQTDFRALPERRGYASPLSGWRLAYAGPYQLATAALLLAALAALAWRAWISDRVPLGPMAMIVMVFAAYSLARLAILSYVAVFMGGFDPRMVFSTNAIGVLLALPAIADAAAASARLRSA